MGAGELLLVLGSLGTGNSSLPYDIVRLREILALNWTGGQFMRNGKVLDSPYGHRT